MAASAAQGKRSPPPLRILCFGDSLSCGYPVDHPYAGRLTEVLEEELKSQPRGQGRASRKVECVVNGEPGDLVTGQCYRDRMQISWETAPEPFDWTIVLGGTNDLGWGQSVEQIIEGLKRTWDIPLSRGGKVLALTIPETKRKVSDMHDKRGEVNKFIKEYKRDNFFHFDHSAEFPYHKLTGPDRVKYWNPDGLHLTAAGYDLMGEKIARGLIRIIRLAEAREEDLLSSVVAPGDARQRKAIEDLIFEEERGDPRLLSQGYIVVRRKDLD
ncbi:GDSL-like Lipase/Acylhydrolase [Xylariaceae sp. FL0594]|nr:GDSL-like Lipase/Acylhydrolase [Xylariaceae sp. FL0594]